MDRRVDAVRPSFPVESPKTGVELQGRDAGHMAVCDSIPGFRGPGEAADQFAFSCLHDHHSGADHRLGAQVYDAWGVRKASESSFPKTPADGGNPSVQGAGKCRKRRSREEDSRCPLPNPRPTAGGTSASGESCSDYCRCTLAVDAVKSLPRTREAAMEQIPKILTETLDILYLDPSNPRLGRHNIEKRLVQEGILEVMKDWTLEELGVSFLESGFGHRRLSS